MRRSNFLGAGIVCICAALLWNANTPVSAASTDLAAVKRQFIGHYELLSFISYAEDGSAIDNEYEGRITYDAFDNMTAQGMPKNLPARAALSSENVRGGFAYYGDVTWDVANQIVVHHVQGSPSRGSWVGEDNVRHYEWEDGLLKLSIKNPEGRITGTLTWRKYQ
ncbi:MAG: hypothetical protein ACSHXZ_03530 [Gammaproteobacteria bacterium]